MADDLLASHRHISRSLRYVKSTIFAVPSRHGPKSGCRVVAEDHIGLHDCHQGLTPEQQIVTHLSWDVDPLRASYESLPAQDLRGDATNLRISNQNRRCGVVLGNRTTGSHGMTVSEPPDTNPSRLSIWGSRHLSWSCGLQRIVQNPFTGAASRERILHTSR